MERWEQLFADLEGSFSALESQELADLLQEQIRSEAAQICMWQRLAGAAGQEIQLDLAWAGSIAGKVLAAASQWVLLSSKRRQVLIPMASVLSFGAVRGVAGEPGTGKLSAAEVTLNRALRILSRDREHVTVCTHDKQVSGFISAVSNDHITIISGGYGEWEERRAARATNVATSHISYIYGS